MAVPKPKPSEHNKKQDGQQQRRTPSTKPPFTVSQLKKAIPSHYFHRTLLCSSSTTSHYPFSSTSPPPPSSTSPSSSGLSTGSSNSKAPSSQASGSSPTTKATKLSPTINGSTTSFLTSPVTSVTDDTILTRALSSSTRPGLHPETKVTNPVILKVHEQSSGKGTNPSWYSHSRMPFVILYLTFKRLVKPTIVSQAILIHTVRFSQRAKGF